MGQNPLGESEEMYLLTLAMLIEAGETPPIAIARLAEALGLQPVSVNQMVHHLEHAGLVRYQPYQGADLTQEGRARALQILRRRRIWETFLVERLGYDEQEAEALACKLEHATRGDTSERLAAFLENPERSPQGKLIPQERAAELDRVGIPLGDLPAGARGRIAGAPIEGTEGAFLREAGIQPGAGVYVLALDSVGNSLVETDGGIRIHLTPALTQTILVEMSEVVSLAGS